MLEKQLAKARCSMNKWFGTGRLTKDPTINKTSNGVSIARITLACDGWKKDEKGKPIAEFIPCVAWKEKADFIANYCKKGDKIGVVGSLGSREYEQDGQKKSITEITIEQMELMASKLKEDEQNKSKENKNDYIEIDDDNLPF